MIDKISPRPLLAQESSPSAHTLLQKESTQETIAAFQAQYTPTMQPLLWFPDSNHLIHTEDDRITVLEYDGTNRAVIYSGPFENQFAYPWPDGTKLLILTNLNSESTIPPNLYAISLR